LGLVFSGCSSPTTPSIAGDELEFPLDTFPGNDNNRVDDNNDEVIPPPVVPETGEEGDEEVEDGEDGEEEPPVEPGLDEDEEDEEGEDEEGEDEDGEEEDPPPVEPELSIGWFITESNKSGKTTAVNFTFDEPVSLVLANIKITGAKFKNTPRLTFSDNVWSLNNNGNVMFTGKIQNISVSIVGVEGIDPDEVKVLQIRGDD